MIQREYEILKVSEAVSALVKILMTPHEYEIWRAIESRSELLKILMTHSEYEILKNRRQCRLIRNRMFGLMKLQLVRSLVRLGFVRSRESHLMRRRSRRLC